jgi:hypothetical protein
MRTLAAIDPESHTNSVYRASVSRIKSDSIQTTLKMKCGNVLGLLLSGASARCGQGIPANRNAELGQVTGP